MKYKTGLIVVFTLIVTHALCLFAGGSFVDYQYKHIGPSRVTVADNAALETIVNNLRQTDYAICMFIGQYGVAPADLSQLVSVGLLKELPQNPYYDRPAYNIRLDAKQRAGDYTYLTGMTVTTYDGKVIGNSRNSYWLIGFGDDSPQAVALNREFNTASFTELFLQPYTDTVFRSGNISNLSPNYGLSVQYANSYASDTEVLKEYGYDRKQTQAQTK